ncbi:MAG: glycosyl transferase family protein [uncultured bacterium]|uniref:Glycosyl transferase, family 2 n=1 Tax=Candidatus Daviesbacteria bacterium GW2011_GWC2_40_12 TaxID=1618431 RepID=A0A0G0QR67_9BACT|nr:MAG: glycosyl transferase family protein [uncultured bacterium]KKR17219.1 MAG: Glycosyl transferase, family 2 [Candidatus Daviesbacteria bacterium GW2011_GWA2_39_33]KKR42618.1 MAG: Glycosyl transferase, family 2 [Candidatus Daviesbacteria bacterium GW2011_GWC2_40_12]OGE21294.1 MAG: hypothetical protein A2778_03955 [Candidatus Daviesbacteria bacterium RIFCSPHIGHO2_01_FULL_40_24]OGE30188.1 MAG: hypothetical protein A3C29_02165 [Candidatus Daviesbacteria bacterium RIFCSPHIGHO2_02_FULL_40_16]OG
MSLKISVVINTLNNEKDIKRALESVKWADEVVVCDMHSEDQTSEIVRKMGVKMVFHKRLEYVEPARNFAVSKASGDWVLIIDPDEEVQASLAEKLMQVANNMKQISYLRLPRKNIIFGKWMKASMWWPDYNIRFFKKGEVEWTDKIHRQPKASDEGLDLPADEKFAIIHYHYESVSQYLERMFRYTGVQADELKKSGCVFDPKDLIRKPLGEFLGRFFANKGFEDGLHGLSLSLLQAFSEFVVILRLWELSGFKSQEIDLRQLKEIGRQSGEEIDYWFKYGNLSKNTFKRFFQKIGNKL